MTRKRLAWSRDTLQDAKGIHIYGIDEPYHEEDKMALPSGDVGSPTKYQLKRI
jgi:hypothetical protein